MACDQPAPPTAADTASRFPEAVAFARDHREVFGPDTRMIYAKSCDGQTLGQSVFTDTSLAKQPSN